MTKLLLDEADFDADEFDAMMSVPDEQWQQWRVATTRQLAALPLTFPLTVDWESRKPPALPLTPRAKGAGSGLPG